MLPITEKLLDNYNRPKRKLKQLKAIVIHWTANTNRGANALANRNYFNTKPFIYGRKSDGSRFVVYASAHYLVDDSTIIQCIPDDEVAFHVGAKWSSYKKAAFDLMGTNKANGDSPNNYTIGIEMCVNSDGDFSLTRQNTIELTRFLMNKHQLKRENILRHFDITGKDCPKMLLEDSLWNAFLDEIENDKKLNQKLKVNTAVLNVRSGAGTQFPILRKLYNGDLVEKKEVSGLWYRIGPNEWVHSHYVIEV